MTNLLPLYLSPLSLPFPLFSDGGPNLLVLLLLLVNARQAAAAAGFPGADREYRSTDPPTDSLSIRRMSHAQIDN